MPEDGWLWYSHIFQQEEGLNHVHFWNLWISEPSLGILEKSKHCIGYLDMLQNIFSYMKKKILIDSHVQILGRNARFWQKLLLFIQGDIGATCWERVNWTVM